MNRGAEGRGQRGRRQRAENRGQRAEQSKSGAIRTVCVSFVSYRLFGGGRGRFCLNSRSRRPPPSPHPKKFIKIGLSPYRLDGDFCHCRIEDWGVIIFVCGGRKSIAVLFIFVCEFCSYLISGSFQGPVILYSNSATLSTTESINLPSNSNLSAIQTPSPVKPPPAK